MQDRRSEERLRVSLAAFVQRADGRRRLSLTRDLSTSGARLVVTSDALDVGDVVSVCIFLVEDVQPRVVTRGRVLRVRALEEPGLWRREIAVQFDEPVPRLHLPRNAR